MPALRRELERLDGKPYPAYRDLRGRAYALQSCSIRLVHVQGDPFASPSRLVVDVPASTTALPRPTVAGRAARRASADFLHRAAAAALLGADGALRIAAVGQEVLERTALRIDSEGGVTVRLFARLPAAGRRIRGGAAARLLVDGVEGLVAALVAAARRDAAALGEHVRCVEDQVALRDQLAARELVAFLADGSVLPRRSGADDRPLAGAIPLLAPEGLAVVLDSPHAGALRGLAIRRGVTLIAGGGYHGKSTLLQALARGVYDHVPGDGRERCVSDLGAVAVRAEDGRSVRGVDLRAFIGALPLGRDTARFDSADASGSTSQAAAIVEALEVGATALLIDEDTAATNFMVRDARMRELVPDGEEPITPFLDRVVQLQRERWVSSVLVIGGAGDYLDVADAVIRMRDYRVEDATAAARAIAERLPRPRAGGSAEWPRAAPRIPTADSIDPRRGGRRERVRARRTQTIEVGDEEIDVSLLGQLVDDGQCRMIGDVLLACARELCDGRRSVAEILTLVEERIAADGIDALAASGWGDRALPRRFEIAAALNRLRTLRVVG